MNSDLQTLIDNVQHEDGCALSKLEYGNQVLPGPQCTCSVGKAIKAVEGMVLVPDALLQELKDWINKVYPADVFTGESGDEGAIKVSAMRDSLNMIEAANA